MSEHTKGPWRYEPISTCGAVYQGSDYRMEVCRVNGRDGEQQANARLIAAAPQLLEACEAVNRLVEILDRKIRLVSQRRGGSFGIAVDESPIGREWQALDAEERAIRCSVDAAIRAAREG